MTTNLIEYCNDAISNLSVVKHIEPRKGDNL